MCSLDNKKANCTLLVRTLSTQTELIPWMLNLDIDEWSLFKFEYKTKESATMDSTVATVDKSGILVHFGPSSQHRDKPLCLFDE